MSIATELTRIQQAKADIKTAIEAKGVTVPSSATIDTYDDYVSQISGGGGGLTQDVSGTPYCDSTNLVVDVQRQISVDGGTSWVNSGSQFTVIVETGASQCQGGLEFIPFDTRMEQYQDKYIKRIVIGDSSTYSGGTFDMGETGGSRLSFGSDGSTVTAYGDFVVDGVTNLTLPIDITPVNPVQLTNNNWGKTNVISWWPYEAEIYNGFSDLQIEWA